MEWADATRASAKVSWVAATWYEFAFRIRPSFPGSPAIARASERLRVGFLRAPSTALADWVSRATSIAKAESVNANASAMMQSNDAGFKRLSRPMSRLIDRVCWP